MFIEHHSYNTGDVRGEFVKQLEKRLVRKKAAERECRAHTYADLQRILTKPNEINAIARRLDRIPVMDGSVEPPVEFPFEALFPDEPEEERPPY